MRPASSRQGSVLSRAGVVALAGACMLVWGGCGGRRSEPPRRVSVATMSPPPPAISPPAVVETPPPPPAEPPPPVAAAASPSSPGRRLPSDDDPGLKDQYGFNGDRYLSLLTPEEVDILRLRARGDLASHLSRFLSNKEKENLRRRAAELTEIGAEPLRIGE
jgi:hypothetical protein